MSQEILALVGEMGWGNVEIQMAFQCAPLIAGLKLSNLLMIGNEDLQKVKNIMQRTRLSYYIVAVTPEKTAVLLFDRKLLEQYLHRNDVWGIFQKMGYQDSVMGRILYDFRERYQKYLAGEREFPHEMGLLLGYPVEDVEGYILNDGENCLYTGYWKVYENLSQKLCLFHEFEKARDALLQLLSTGFGIVEIIQKRLLTQSLCVSV